MLPRHQFKCLNGFYHNYCSIAQKKKSGAADGIPTEERNTKQVCGK